MECRVGCGACCIAPSITSPIPGMLGGKPAGIRCIQLTGDNKCKLFGKPERPEVCKNLRPSREMCGASTEDANLFLAHLEEITNPGTHEEKEKQMGYIEDLRSIIGHRPDSA